MYRISTSWLGLGCLVAVSCGAPAELDEDRFPGVDDTGYTDGSGGSVNGGAGALPAGGAGSTPAGGAGGTASGTGGAGVAQQGGSAGAPAAAGAGGGAVAGGCPDDITLLFNRPIEQGGCAGAACHIPGATPPDLVSPNPEQRLVNKQGSASCGSRPYISATESLLGDKIAANPAPCGFAMPFAMPAALSAADEACILAWIDEVSGG